MNNFKTDVDKLDITKLPTVFFFFDLKKLSDVVVMLLKKQYSTD